MATAPPGANVTGIELDPVTAEIAGALHPDHTIANQSLSDYQPGNAHASLAIGNVPFADLAPTDHQLNPQRVLALHNYVIVKAATSLEPGSPIIVITSPFTLDSRNPAARLEIARHAELAGSLRLPDIAFQAQSGTSVTTDVLVLRTRDHVLTTDQAREAVAGQAWLETHQLPVIDIRTGDPAHVTVNAVYTTASGPNVVGEITNGGMYNHDQARVVAPDDYEQALTAGFDHLATATRHLFAASTVSTVSHEQRQPVPAVVTTPRRSRPEPIERDPARPAPPWVKPGGLFGRRSTGFWQQTTTGAIRYQSKPKTDARALDAYLALRDAYFELIDAEQNPASEHGMLDQLRQHLNRCYDTAVRTLGHPLGHFTMTTTKNGERRPRYPPIGGARRHDPDFHAVLALEHYDPYTHKADKAAIFTHRQLHAPQPVERCDTPAEAVAVSLAEHGRIDETTIAELLDIAPSAVADHLTGAAFLDHETDTDQWLPAATYLSGNVRDKLARATDRARHDRRFEANVEALTRATPASLDPEEISVQLGAPWLTAEEVATFLRDTLGHPLQGLEILFHPAIGWKMSFPKHLELGEAITGTYGTSAMSALRIAAAALQGRPIRVVREEPTTGRRSVDRAATVEANGKLDELNAALSEWITADPDRASILAQRYNRLFRSHAPPDYQPTWPRPPGLAGHLELRDHQNTAVTRALLDGSIGLYHAVGAGKTITMATIAVELRRLGLARKPLLVVPNHLVDQIASEFRRAYPAASVLVPADRSLKGRAKLVSSIVAGDWDAIVFSHQLFRAIPVAPETEISYLEQRCDELREALTLTGHGPPAGHPDTDDPSEELDDGQTPQPSRRPAKRGSAMVGDHKRTAKQIEKAIARFEEQIKRLQSQKVDPTLRFESLGIDALLADEAHHFKNLVLPGTNSSEVVGTPSGRAMDLDMKLGVLRRQAGERRLPVVLATGTPVTNSFAELWVMMRYLQPDVLDAAEIARFDQFLAQFGKTVTDYELRPTGDWQLKSRIAKFNNVPDLQLLFAQTADVLLSADLPLKRPDLDGGARQAIVVPNSPQLAAYIQTLASRAANLDPSDPSEDNPLTIYTDGRKAALSLQLVGHPEPSPSKLDLAANRILTTWHATRHNTYLDPRTGEPHPVPGALQIVFMDFGVPGPESPNRIDLYRQLRDLLADGGLPPDKVAFVQDAGNDKEALFEQCRHGRYAVLLGSTATMGTGMNVQTRAVSLIHMDPTWTPADMEQREGRILRPGNQNPSVTIYNMLSEGSTDSLMYQGLERKAHMIDQVLTTHNTDRTVTDVGGPLVQFGDMKAIATGNPLVVEQLDLKRQIEELQIKQHSWTRRATRLAKGLPGWRERATALGPRIEQLEQLQHDIPSVASWPITCFGHTTTNRAQADQLLRQHRSDISYDPGRPTKVGTLGPWPVEAVAHRAYTVMRGDTTDYELIVRAADHDLTFTARFSQDEMAAESKAQLWRRITNRPSQVLGSQIALDEESLRRVVGDIEQAERFAGRPFPEQAQLDDLRAQLAQVEEQLTEPARREASGAASPAAEPPGRQRTAARAAGPDLGR